MLDLKLIVGLRVVALKGVQMKGRVGVKLGFILLSDKKTYIALDEQDGYTYHDCNPDARSLIVCVDKANWKTMKSWSDATYL